MPLNNLDHSLRQEIEALKAEGRAKAPERIIVEYIPPKGGKGPRYRLQGFDKEYLRMNSNSYLSLSNDPGLIEAADVATRKLGVGPGAVRFIDGTYAHHIALEERIARFTDKPAAKIFNSAYTAPLGVADCAAAMKAIDICDSAEGQKRLKNLKERIQQFRQGIGALGLESIPGPHPVVPLMVRDTARTHRLVQYLFDHGVLVVGLTFPVVPHGDETIRFQINAAHTQADIDEVLGILSGFKQI